MSDIAISIRGVGKEYALGFKKPGSFRESLSQIFNSQPKSDKKFWALKELSFDIKQGESLGIIGRNGAGKSTLLKILSKITEPTAGRIEINGRIASLLEVGTGFHPELTGRENIFLNGTILGMSRTEIRNKLEEIIDFSGVEKFIDTPVKHYSSGMYVRLAFSVAAHLDPEILVVDEVLAVGDAEFQKKCLGKMQDVSTDGRTVLFVSHNMSSLQKICETGIYLNNGQLLYQGPIGDCISKYSLSTQDHATVRLADRTDRKNKGAFKFTNIDFLDQEDSQVDILVSGKKYVFRINFEAYESINVKGIRMMIMDHLNSTRILCNTGVIGVSPKEIQKTMDGHLDFIFEKFPLPKGDFNIRLSCFSVNGIEDDIDATRAFKVAGGDFYGVGKEASIKEGVLVSYDAQFH